MNNYAPPGYMLFSGLFNHFSNLDKSLIQFSDVVIEESDKVTIYDIDRSLHNPLDDVLTKLQVFQPLEYTTIIRTINKKTFESKASSARYLITDVHHDKILVAKDDYNKTVNIGIANTTKLLKISMILHGIRDAFCEGKIVGYFVNGDNYAELSPKNWLDNELWYFLVATNKCINLRIFFNKYEQYAIPTKIFHVYFKCAEVSSFLEDSTSTISIHPIEKNQPNLMFHMFTPWLEIMSHFSLKYLDNIFSISKEAIEVEMSEYIDQRNLGISKCDIPYLAKFIRHPDQRKGKLFKKPIV